MSQDTPKNSRPGFFRSLLHILNPFEWIHAGVTTLSVLLLAFRHTTWDQVTEAVQHVKDRAVPVPAKALLMVLTAGSLLVVVIIWLVFHGMFPFMLLSIVEDIFLLVVLLAMEMVICWAFNWYARSCQPPPPS